MDPQTLIGQLFFISMEAETYRPGNPHLKRMIEEFHPSGVILFPPGCRSRSSMRACLDELQLINAKAGLPGPLVVCADHRGGEGTQTSRIAEGLEFPAPMTQCALGDDLPTAAEEMGRVIGEDALSLGINLNLAPYADFLERGEIEGFQFGQAIMGSDPATNAILSAGLVRDFIRQDWVRRTAFFRADMEPCQSDPHFFAGNDYRLTGRN